MTAVIRWEDPPRARHGTDVLHPAVHNWPAIVRALKSKPGRWALVAVCGKSGVAGATAWHIRTGTYAEFRPAGSYEAKARTVDGEPRIYARYVSEEVSTS